MSDAITPEDADRIHAIADDVSMSSAYFAQAIVDTMPAWDGRPLTEVTVTLEPLDMAKFARIFGPAFGYVCHAFNCRYYAYQRKRRKGGARAGLTPFRFRRRWMP